MTDYDAKALELCGAPSVEDLPMEARGVCPRCTCTAQALRKAYWEGHAAALRMVNLDEDDEYGGLPPAPCV